MNRRPLMVAAVLALGVMTPAGGCISPYACEAYPPRVHAALGEMRERHAAITVLYATDRNDSGRLTPGERYGPDRTRQIRFGRCEVSIPEGHGRGRCEEPFLGTWSDENHVRLGEVKQSESRDAFVRLLRERVARSPRKEIFVFIHGYCVTFSSAVRRTAQIAHDVDLQGVAICYSWPAQGSLLSYLVDAGNAEWSAVYLSQFLALLADESGAERIHLMAHSMGTQVLTRAIKELATERQFADKSAFDQIILAAADMDAEIFERDYLRFLLWCSRRLTIYVSEADWALGGSRRLHRYARLGQIGSPKTRLEDLKKLEMIDATDCDRGFIGHTYYAECPTILEDIHQVLAGTRAADRGLPQRFYYRIELEHRTIENKVSDAVRESKAATKAAR